MTDIGETGGSAGTEDKGVLERSLDRIEERLEELRPFYEEFLELEQAVERLIDEGVAEAKEFVGVMSERAASIGVSARRAALARLGRQPARAARGSHADNLLAVVERHPEGISVAEISRELDATPNYLYRVAAKLHEQGKIGRKGRLYVPRA